MESKLFLSISQPSFLDIGKVAGCATLGVIVWEHFGKKKNTIYRPSTGLNLVADKSVQIFENVGRKFSWMSSYLTKIDPKYIVATVNDVGATIRDIGSPIFRLIASPGQALYGYVHATCCHNYQKRWLVYVGSFILICGTGIGIKYGYNQIWGQQLTNLILSLSIKNNN